MDGARIRTSAKSHQYYHYQCNSNYREGKDDCKSGLIPKEKIESAVITQVQETVLTEKNLKGLVKLVNEARIQIEADSILQHSRVLNANAIREYVDDLKALLD